MNKFIFLKIVLIYLGICFLNSCIEPFNPDIDEGKQLIVINGSVTNEEGYQYAEISTTSPFDNPVFNPLNDCQAKIIDDKGNEFEMEQYAEGKYRTWIEEQYLQTGTQYKIEVVLDNGNGKRYESEFDTLLPCPDIDKIYFEFKNVIPDNPAIPPQEGIQFYVDFDATGDYANNYRWEAIETWEYNAEEKTYIIYYGVEYHCCYSTVEYPLWDPCHDIDIDTCWAWLNLRFLDPSKSWDVPLIDSLYTCWKTGKVNDIFTYSSNQKTNKKVIGLPLYLITNKDNRLTIKYSILLKQIALSDAAFVYWNQLQTQSQESGGLYDTQPYELKGNIKCINDENEKVIGIFSASSVKTKRFTTPILMNRNYYFCVTKIERWRDLLRYLWGGDPGQIPNSNTNIPDTPLYLHPFFNNVGLPRKDTFSLIDQSCIDCRLKGGTLTKPDYW